jgi:hypothetical protein
MPPSPLLPLLPSLSMPSLSLSLCHPRLCRHSFLCLLDDNDAWSGQIFAPCHRKPFAVLVILDDAVHNQKIRYGLFVIAKIAAPFVWLLEADR